MEEDKTTTEAVIQDAGADNAQPVVDDNATAVQTENQPEQQTKATDSEEVEQPNTEDDSVEENADDDLNKFAKAKGLELDSDNARKAAKMAMESEKRMHQATSKAGELQKNMINMSDQSAEQVAQATGQNPDVIKRLQAMEVKESIRDFFDANPGARDYESQMSQIATEAGLYGSPTAILKASYAQAKLDDSNATANVKSQGKREALESLAHKQQAAVPRGNATNSSASTSEKPFDSLSLEEMEAKLGVVRR